MELWNLYDYNGRKKEKVAIRGSKLKDDEFHLVVNVWIMNNKGEFLITQRAPNRSHPLMWECTGGSALISETSLEAAKREVYEEIGINVNEKNAKLIGRTRRYYKNCPDILDVWLFQEDIDLTSVKLQSEEVNNVMWANKCKILELLSKNQFEANSFFNKVININNKIDFYYVGFNANNAICNENFVTGSLTINPNRERGNIFYTREAIIDRNEEFNSKYKKFIIENMKKLSSKNPNSLFLVFNKKMKNLLSHNEKYNIIGEKDYQLIDKLNDKKYIRELLKSKINIIDTIWIDKQITYEEAYEIIKTNKFVIQGKTGAGGDNTYLVDTKEKFIKYAEECNHNYFLSKFVEHLPVNTTIIMGEYDDIIFPSSVQLIKLDDDKFKYVGADFIYYDELSQEIRNRIDQYNRMIIEELKKFNYRGILGIDYIIDNDDNIFFMEINPRFQSSSFIISQYLAKYCNTSLAELHYLAITNMPIGNTYLSKIERSFVNCIKDSDYCQLPNSKILKNGYYRKNNTSCFRKVFNYSILNIGPFQKRKKDV